MTESQAPFCCTAQNTENIKEIFCVEMPGIVSESTPLIDALERFDARNMYEAFNSADSTSQCLRFWSGKDHTSFAPTLHGSIVNCRKILVRLQIDEATGCIQAISVRGIIKKIAKFRGLADFMYSASDYGRSKELMDLTMRIKSLSQPDLAAAANYILQNAEPKPGFERLPIPLSFCQFDSFLCFKNRIISKIHQAVRNPEGALNSTPDWVVKFSVEDDIPAVATLPLPTDTVPASFIDQMKRLFNEKPVWTKIALLSRFSAEDRAKQAFFRKTLPAIAFSYTSGPWRWGWVRYGYDPRVDPESRFLQVLELRNIFFEQSPAYLEQFSRCCFYDESTPHIFDGKTLSKNLASFQLCDITDEHCRIMIESASCTKSLPDKKDGWFPSGFVVRLRDEICARMIKIMKDGNWTNIKMDKRKIKRSSQRGYDDDFDLQSFDDCVAPMQQKQAPESQNFKNDDTENAKQENSDFSDDDSPTSKSLKEDVSEYELLDE